MSPSAAAGHHSPRFPAEAQLPKESMDRPSPATPVMSPLTGSSAEDITTDDLAAMKAMIGDIKRDPSLLYRLSPSLGGGLSRSSPRSGSAEPIRQVFGAGLAREGSCLSPQSRGASTGRVGKRSPGSYVSPQSRGASTGRVGKRSSGSPAKSERFSGSVRERRSNPFPSLPLVSKPGSAETSKHHPNMSKKLEGRRTSVDENAKDDRSRRRRSKGEETKDSSDSDSAALVLYEGQNKVGPLPGGEKEDFGVSEGALTVSPKQEAKPRIHGVPNPYGDHSHPVSTASYYHSAVSKYAIEERRRTSFKTTGSASGIGPKLERKGSSSGHGSKLERKGSQRSEASGTSKASASSKRSKSALPRHKRAASERKPRSISAQPVPHRNQDPRSLRGKSSTGSASGLVQKLERKESVSSIGLKLERKGSHGTEASASSRRSKSVLPRHKRAPSERKLRSISAQPVPHRSQNPRSLQGKFASSHCRPSRDPPQESGAPEHFALLEQEAPIVHSRAEPWQPRGQLPIREASEYSAKEKVRRRKNKKERVSPSTEHDAPPQSLRLSQRRFTAPVMEHYQDDDLIGGSAREAREMSFSNTTDPIGGSAREARDVSFENKPIPTLGQGLDRLAQKGPSPRRSSNFDERSVLSRLSHLRRRNRTSSKRSEGSGQAGTVSFCSASPHVTGGSGEDSPEDHHLWPKGLVSRIPHFGASPKATARRRLGDNVASPVTDFHRRTLSYGGANIPVSPSLATSFENDKPSLVASSESDNKGQLEHIPYISNEGGSEHVTQGIELAIRSGEVPRLCDERGRCLFHPHIRLQKPKLFGGWKVLFQHCPDCAVEHMKKTQEKLKSENESKKSKAREGKKKSHRKAKDKKREEDPIIGDDDFAEVEKKSRRKSHHRRSHRSSKKDKGNRKGEGQEEAPPSSEAGANEEEKPDRDPERPEAATARLEGGDMIDHQDANDHNGRDEGDRIGERNDTSVQHNGNDHDEREQGNRIGERNKSHPSVEEADHQATPSPPPPPPLNESSEQEVQSTALVPVDSSSQAIVDYEPKPNAKRVNGLPWSDYNGHSGRYTGEVNAQYLPHGRGEMVYDRGVVSAGIWYDGVLDTDGDPNLALVESSSAASCGENTMALETRAPPDTLQNYCIGDKGRDEYMIIEGKQATCAAVSELRTADAAFVRRSDGSWTYAIVKDRTYGDNAIIRFKVNVRGSTKAFPTSQWGTYIRRIKKRAASPEESETKPPSLGDFLEGKHRSNSVGRPLMSASSSLAGMLQNAASDDASASSFHSAPLISSANHRSTDNLTTAKMKVRTRSRSRSRNRKNVTTLPLLFSSSMSVSEENEGNDAHDDWETASGSGYRLRGIDP